jgi:hypothetical protein
MQNWQFLSCICNGIGSQPALSVVPSRLSHNLAVFALCSRTIVTWLECAKTSLSGMRFRVNWRVRSRASIASCWRGRLECSPHSTFLNRAGLSSPQAWCIWLHCGAFSLQGVAWPAACLACGLPVVLPGGPRRSRTSCSRTVSNQLLHIAPLRSSVSC